MVQEEVLQLLKNLGLRKAEAKTYFYLSKKGPKKAKEITIALKMKRQQLYPILKRLQNKAIVTVSLDRPAEFSAIPFNKTLDILAKARIKEAKAIQKNKINLLSEWEHIKSSDAKDKTAKFTIIKGRNYVYSKIQQMIQETRNQFLVISNSLELLHEDQFGVFDAIQYNPHKKKIQIRIITEISHNHLKAFKEFLDGLNSQFTIKGRNTKTGLPIIPKMVIRDNQEIMYFIISDDNEIRDKNNLTCLYTDCASLVKPFSNIFEEIWKKSLDIEQKLYQVKYANEGNNLSIELNEDEIFPPFNILKHVSCITLIENMQFESIEERNLINKIISAEKKSSARENFEGYHSYSSSGLAVIKFNYKHRIPDLLIRAWHFDKKSIFGQGDVLMIHLWLDTSNNHAYVPVAIVHDQPELNRNWKDWMEGTPAAKNILLFNKDEIQVQTYGKIFFASWTREIPLIKKYTLPPSTLILEGYGNVLTGSFKQIFPSGIQSRAEFNGFEAHATLIYDKTKYSGFPAGGFVFREMLLGMPKTIDFNNQTYQQ